MSDNENLGLDEELAKSIEKLVDEETSVAKAFVDRNIQSKDTKGYSNKDIGKTQIIPDLPSRAVSLDDLQEENSADEEFDFEDELDSEFEEDTNEYIKSKASNNRNNNEKKPLDKKTKMTIIIVSSAVVAVLAAIIVIAVVINNQKKNTYNYNYSKGTTYYNSADYSDAAQYFEKAVLDSKGKKNIELRLKLYDCYVNLGENDKAIEELKDILSYDKYNEKALKELAKYYSDNEQGDKLTELIKKYRATEGEKYIYEYEVETPIASEAGGNYNDAIDLAFNTSDSNKIYYTLDGSEPNEKSELYSEAIHIEKGSTTVKAIAVNSIGTHSDIVELKFNIEYKAPDSPEVSPASGTYESGSKVEISNLKEGDKAYYTIDGSTPTAASTEYTEPFEMPEGNVVISFIIINQYDMESSITKRNYNVAAAKTYTYDEAVEMLKTAMKTKGELKSNGDRADGSKVNFVYYTKKEINNSEMYLVYYDVTTDGKTTRQNYYFGIDCKTGVCYKVTESGNTYSASEY